MIENISFSHIHLTFGGGGTAEAAARRALPNIAGEYFSLGAMPAYGFYARNSRGITLNDVRLQVAATELRPAVILDRVEDVSIQGLQVQGDAKSESAMRLIDTRDVLLSATRLLNEASVFLQVEGENSSNINVDGGDLSKCKSVLSLNHGAPAAAVHLRI